MSPRVLITDYYWPSLDIERRVLAGCELVVAPSTAPDELVALAAGADAIMTCWARVSAEMLDAAPHCRSVARYGVGLDNIDTAHATELGMLVHNVPEYCMEEVADHTVLLLLAANRGLLPLTRALDAGQWPAGGRPAPWAGSRVPMRLRGRTIGLVGFGGIARAVVPRVQALGLRVLAYRRERDDAARAQAAALGVDLTGSLEELLAASDIVSLHCPLTAATRGLIGEPQLRAMRPGALLLNTSRGALIDTTALLRALDGGAIAGAALDVTDPEPLPADHPLRGRPDVVITPHSAFSSDGAHAEVAAKAAAGVADVLAGRVPATLVNPEVLDRPSCRLAGAVTG